MFSFSNLFFSPSRPFFFSTIFLFWLVQKKKKKCEKKTEDYWYFFFITRKKQNYKFHILFFNYMRRFSCFFGGKFNLSEWKTSGQIFISVTEKDEKWTMRVNTVVQICDFSWFTLANNVLHRLYTTKPYVIQFSAQSLGFAQKKLR